MNEPDISDNGDITRAEVAAEFPDFDLSTGTNGLRYAVRHDPFEAVHGEDWTDLRDQLRRYRSQQEEQAWRERHGDAP